MDIYGRYTYIYILYYYHIEDWVYKCKFLALMAGWTTVNAHASLALHLFNGLVDL